MAIRVEDLCSLSEGIQHLNLDFNDPLSDDKLPYLPRFLKTLRLEGNYRLTDNGIAQLPPQLESLHISGNPLLSPNCIPSLPRTLKSLSLYTNAPISPAHMLAMPQNLSHLKLCGAATIPLGSLIHLPDTLTSLHWTFPLGPIEAPLLPTTLRDLTCDSVSSPNCTFASLPRGLKRLIVGRTLGLSSSGIYELPRGLEHLELLGCRDLCYEAIQCLPPGLLVLSMPKITSWSHKELSVLPSSLVKLRLIANLGLCDSDFGWLPEDLHSFTFRWNSNITFALAKYAPMKLRVLKLRVAYNENPVPAIPATGATQRAIRSHYAQPYDTFTISLDTRSWTMELVDLVPRFVPESNAKRK